MVQEKKESLRARQAFSPCVSFRCELLAWYFFEDLFQGGFQQKAVRGKRGEMALNYLPQRPVTLSSHFLFIFESPDHGEKFGLVPV